MSFTVAKIRKTEEMLMASAYAKALMAALEEDDRIVWVDADLALCFGMETFEFLQRFPTHLIDCGIQEGNMVSVAAGLSTAGKIPFAHTFAPFITRRACDQAFISGCYSKSNIKLIGSDPGIAAAYNGGTHMPFEDISVFRAFPEMTILDVCDTTQIADLTRQLAKLYGMYYVRMVRKNMVQVYEPGSTFEIGKGNVLRDGRDVTIIAAGLMVSRALDAADLLEKKGVQARVVDMFTIKPIDRALICRCAEETGAIVTAENHNVIGGLGSAVAEVLVANTPVPMEQVGVQDEFGEVGLMPYLSERFGLTAEVIAQKAKKAVSRKK